MDENHAIQHLKQGNIDGLEWLVQNYQLLAFQAAYLILRDEQLAEDVVQEAYLKVHRNINKFDSTRPFKPWFLRIVMNLAVTTLRKQGKYDSFSDKTSLEEVLAANNVSPETFVEISEFQNAVWEAMEKLSPHQREVIVAHYFLDMSGHEIASGIGNALGTVKWLLSTARKKLRIYLSEKGDDHGSKEYDP